MIFILLIVFISEADSNSLWKGCLEGVQLYLLYVHVRYKATLSPAYNTTCLHVSQSHCLNYLKFIYHGLIYMYICKYRLIITLKWLSSYAHIKNHLILYWTSRNLSSYIRTIFCNKPHHKLNTSFIHVYILPACIMIISGPYIEQLLPLEMLDLTCLQTSFEHQNDSTRSIERPY